MSGNQLAIRGGSGGGSSRKAVVDNLDKLRDKVNPKIVQEVDEDDDGEYEIRREFDPLVVTRLGGNLQWETDSTQLQCSETVTSQDGDQNIRLVFKCIATQSQFKELKKMRSGEGRTKLVSRTYTRPVKFDELKFDRIPDANGSVIRGEGQSDEPLYELQLQSKEDDENDNLG